LLQVAIDPATAQQIAAAVAAQLAAAKAEASAWSPANVILVISAIGGLMTTALGFLGYQMKQVHTAVNSERTASAKEIGDLKAMVGRLEGARDTKQNAANVSDAHAAGMIEGAVPGVLPAQVVATTGSPDLHTATQDTLDQRVAAAVERALAQRDPAPK
jgi:hypothetical protein